MPRTEPRTGAGRRLLEHPYMATAVAAILAIEAGQPRP